MQPNRLSKFSVRRGMDVQFRNSGLAVLQRQVGDWGHIPREIGACDVDLQAMLQQLPSVPVQAQPGLARPGLAPPGLARAGAPVAKRKRKGRKNGKSSKNEPNFNLTAELQRVTGVDLSRIDG